MSGGASRNGKPTGVNVALAKLPSCSSVGCTRSRAHRNAVHDTDIPRRSDGRSIGGSRCSQGSRRLCPRSFGDGHFRTRCYGCAQIRRWPTRAPGHLAQPSQYCYHLGRAWSADKAPWFHRIEPEGVDYDGQTFRAAYTVEFERAVFVLHVFQKKARHGIATPRRDIDLVRNRLRKAREIYREF